MQTLRLTFPDKAKERIQEFIHEQLGKCTSLTVDQFKWDGNELQFTATPVELYRFGYDWMYYQMKMGWVKLEASSIH